VEKVVAAEPPGEDLQSLFDRLRHLTEQLENNELTLEESIATYDKCVELQGKIRKILDDADRKVTEIVREGGHIEPFKVKDDG